MRETNAQHKKGKIFVKACELAKTPATTRQSSKYRRGLGIAIRYRIKAVFLISREHMINLFKNTNG